MVWASGGPTTLGWARDPPGETDGQDERFKIERDPEDALRDLLTPNRDELDPQDEPLRDQGDPLA